MDCQYCHQGGINLNAAKPKAMVATRMSSVLSVIWNRRMAGVRQACCPNLLLSRLCAPSCWSGIPVGTNVCRIADFQYVRPKVCDRNLWVQPEG